jgi:hypothetical protein
MTGEEGKYFYWAKILFENCNKCKSVNTRLIYFYDKFVLNIYLFECKYGPSIGY